MISASHEDLVDRIYEASVLPEFWPEVLTKFYSVASGRLAVMIAAQGANLKWIASSPEAQVAVAENYEHGGMERTARLLGLQRAGFVTDNDVFTDDEIRTTRIFKDYLIPNGYGRGIATVLKMPEDEKIIFHVEGDIALGRYRPDEIDRLDRLRPHLARSAMLSSRLSFERARTSVETLAALGFAACAVRRDGSILVANDDFARGQSYWTTRFADTVALHDRRGEQQLADALARILGDTGVRSIPIRPKGEGLPAVLHVVPVRRAAHDLFNQAAAILVLTMAVPGPTTQTPLLQALFDLTATEADLAARIAAGQTVEQVALVAGKGVETVRSQLKSVLSKTGCHRQADLARLLGQLLPSGM